MKKALALLLGLAVVLGLSGTVLADNSTTPAPSGAVPNAVSQPDQTLRQQARDHLRKTSQDRQLSREQKKQQLAALKEEIRKLRALHQQASQLRHELNAALQDLRRTVGDAGTGRKWQALKAILPQLKAVRQRIKEVRTQYQQGEGALEAFRDAKSARNLAAALGAMQYAEARTQARVEALQQALDSIRSVSAQLLAAPSDTKPPAEGKTPASNTPTGG